MWALRLRLWAEYWVFNFDSTVYQLSAEFKFFCWRYWCPIVYMRIRLHWAIRRSVYVNRGSGSGSTPTPTLRKCSPNEWVLSCEHMEYVYQLTNLEWRMGTVSHVSARCGQS